MGFKCGIVGLPNVGKSTLFNALTQLTIEAENYPFCTIDPHIGVVAVPDPRLQRLADIVQPKKLTPAYMEFVDIAGLVKGASKGEGLGNQFLANIRETNAIAQVVRCFDDDNIIHVAGKIDPVADLAIVNTELNLADLDTVQQALEKTKKLARNDNKEATYKIALFENVLAHLNQNFPVRSMRLSEHDQSIIKQLHLLTHKPNLYIANVEDDQLESNRWLTQLRAIAADEKSQVIPISVAIEAEIARLDWSDQLDFLHTMKMNEPGLNRLIRAGYELLQLQNYFTAGAKEVRAWTIPIGATAPLAAGVIHSDFERGFIRAEVVSYDDYIQYHGEQAAKAAGKCRSEGKDYVVQNGDIIFFRFNV